MSDTHRGHEHLFVPKPSSPAPRKTPPREAALVQLASGIRDPGVLDGGCRDRMASSLHAMVGNAAVQRALGASTQRATKMGTQVTHPKGVKSKYRTVTATFNGAVFEAKGDGVVLFSVPAQSGRPYTVSKADAAVCKGSPDDSYMNNPRYLGIKDNGPIPEGEYRFLATEMTNFSTAEQAQMLLGGNYVDPRGVSLHGGDWGAGRVGLTPIRVLPSKFCGNTAARSGFFLHGGVMPGSSGCIDIGDGAFASFVRHLLGYRAAIAVTVRYNQPPAEVGALERAAGRFTYPGRGKVKDPSIWDRVKSLFSGDEE